MVLRKTEDTGSWDFTKNRRKMQTSISEKWKCLWIIREKITVEIA